MRPVGAIRRASPAPETKRAPAPVPTVSAAGRFEGYASLFGREDLSGDVVEAGAFRRSLAERGAAGVKLLFQHDPHEPVGRWLEIAEDRTGLRVVGELVTGTRRGREVMSLMRLGLVDGLSIGFRTVRSRTGPGGGVRRLLEIDLWEISIVTFPMLPGARLRAAKTARPPLAADAATLVARLGRCAQDLRKTR